MAKKANTNEYVDPAIGAYEQGLKAFFGGKFDKAAKHFEEVQEAAEQTDLVARARTFANASLQRLEDPVETDDPFLEAVVAKNRGDLETAMDLCTRGGRKGKDERFAYLAASVEALRENHADAVSMLQQAIELHPENRIHAQHDPDFDALREVDEFRAVVYSSGDSDDEPDA
ncbi:MAG: hypothetical protein DWQ36_23020 [Acidobacteria bacterium]|nr:MAG: hypothetical protein DWQ36_23020 [Acidobacteriota bacterium]